MNFKEFESSFLEYLDSKRDCENNKCIAFIRDGETGDALIVARCTQDEAMKMIFVIARKCGITLKELAYMCIAIDSNKDASKALEGLIKESNKQDRLKNKQDRLKKAIASIEKAKATLNTPDPDADKNSDESQKKGDSDDEKTAEDIADVISAVLIDVLKSLDD